MACDLRRPVALAVRHPAAVQAAQRRHQRALAGPGAAEEHDVERRDDLAAGGDPLLQLACGACDEHGEGVGLLGVLDGALVTVRTDEPLGGRLQRLARLGDHGLEVVELAQAGRHRVRDGVGELAAPQDARGHGDAHTHIFWRYPTSAICSLGSFPGSRRSVHDSVPAPSNRMGRSQTLNQQRPLGKRPADRGWVAHPDFLERTDVCRRSWALRRRLLLGYRSEVGPTIDWSRYEDS